MSQHRLELPCSVPLLDGGVMLLRRLEVGDLGKVLALHKALSDTERYLRFFTWHPTELNRLARKLSEQSKELYALGGFESGHLIGIANYVSDNPHGLAEAAIAVAHANHVRGVGTALLKRLTEIAIGNGVCHFVADVLTENYPMRRLLQDAGWPSPQSVDSSVLSFDFDIAATAEAMANGSARHRECRGRR